jgi:hypothetical protein
MKKEKRVDVLVLTFLCALLQVVGFFSVLA